MKRFLAAVVFVAFASVLAYESYDDLYQEVPYGLIEDIINETIEGLRPNISDPWVFDPIVISGAPGDIIAGNLTIDPLTIVGLQSFELTFLQVTLAGILANFTLQFPVVDASLNFVADASLLGAIPVFGTGTGSAHFPAVVIEGSTNVHLGEPLQISNLRIAVGVEVFELHLSGMWDDDELSEILASLLGDILTKLIHENGELITQILSPLVETIINGLLQGTAPISTTTDVPTTTAAPTTVPVAGFLSKLLGPGFKFF